MKNLTQRVEGTLYREVDLRADSTIDEKSRTVRISVSSETPVLRRSFFSAPWIETLGHKSGEVDLGRLKNGATVHYNHSRRREDRIGVVESAVVNKNRVEAVVRFSKSSRVNDVWDDVRDGVLRNVSVGYSINERKLTREGSEGGPDEFRVTSWTPMEVSFVDIPADPTVGVGRDESGNLAYRVIDIPPGTNEGGQPMNDNQNGDNNVSQLPELNPALKTEIERRGLIGQIFDAFRNHTGIDALREQCKDDINMTVEQARQKLLNHLGQDNRPAGGDPIMGGEFGMTRDLTADRQDEFFRAATDATLVRNGIPVKEPSTGTRDLQGMNLIEIARTFVGRSGFNTSRLSPNDIVKRALTTSDFPLLLANVADKSVIQGYNEATGSHRGWTRESFAKDFKDKSYVAAGETPDLQLVNEGGEFKYGVLVETGTNVALQTYGRLMAFSRQAIINDDTSSLLASARNFGNSAMRLESDITYGVLIGNPVMQDGQTLFHATHNNIATAAVPTVTSLGEMRQLLRNQKGLGGDSFLDLQPFAVLAPTTLETVLEQLLSSLFDPFPATTGDTNARNPFANRLELIVDPRLDVDSTTRWYLVTNPNSFNWAERITLEGQVVPRVEEQTGWSVDGLEIKAAHDFAALITEFRGIVKNDGV